MLACPDCLAGRPDRPRQEPSLSRSPLAIGACSAGSRTRAARGSFSCCRRPSCSSCIQRFVRAHERGRAGSGRRGPAVLQVSTYDLIGGAERVAWNLFQAYRQRGHASWLAVGTKLGTDPDVLVDSRACQVAQPSGISGLNGCCPDSRSCLSLARLAKALDRMLRHRGLPFPRHPAAPERDRPTSRRASTVTTSTAGTSTCERFRWLSRQLPLVVTLHDAWLLSGHCAHSFDCERWKDGLRPLSGSDDRAGHPARCHRLQLAA